MEATNTYLTSAAMPATKPRAQQEDATRPEGITDDSCT